MKHRDIKRLVKELLDGTFKGTVYSLSKSGRYNKKRKGWVPTKRSYKIIMREGGQDTKLYVSNILNGMYK